MSQEAQWLRSRARHLRHFANDIERTTFLSLGPHAGPWTWNGPAAGELARRLAWLVARLDGEVGQLRSQAWLFEKRADDLEAAAAIAAAAGAPL